MSETVPVEYRIEAVVPVHGKGRLVALARVRIEVAGVVLLFQGFQVRTRPDGGLECHAPAFRDLDGTGAPAVVLPPELADAIARELLETFT